MSWNFIDLCIKYTQPMQDRPKFIWMGPHIGWPSIHFVRPIFSNWRVVDEIYLARATGKYIIYRSFYVHFINETSMLITWVVDTGTYSVTVLSFLHYFMSYFRSYIRRLGTLWFCYIRCKLFPHNPGICSLNSAIEITTSKNDCSKLYIIMIRIVNE